MLASHEREHPEDHHFEPVNYRRDLIRTKNASRRNKRRRRKQLHNLMHATSSASIDSRAENQSVMDGMDEVPDVPMPVSEFPEDYDEYKEPDDMVPGIPLQELQPRPDLRAELEAERDTVPLSPTVIIDSKQTEV